MFYNNRLFVQAIILQSKRCFIYSSKKGIDVDTIAKFQRPIDFSILGILNWFDKKQKELLVKKHNYNEAMVENFGIEVAAAQFILKLQGQIKIKNGDKWISDVQLIPLIHQNTLEIEAIDVHKTEFMYNSFSNIQLSNLQYLDISECVNIDDWCINHLIKFRDTLLYLDLSKCPNVTERGIATLHRLKKLKRLRFCSMTRVENIGLLHLMLEEQLPECYIQTDINSSIKTEDITLDETPMYNDLKNENYMLKSIFKYLTIRNPSDEKKISTNLYNDKEISNIENVTNNSSLNNRHKWINTYLKKIKVEK